MPHSPFPRTARGVLLTLLLLLLPILAGCGSSGVAPAEAVPQAAAAAPAAETAQAEAPPRGVTLLAINDVYRIEGVDDGTRGGMARVRTLRRELEEERGRPVLILHAGDLLYPSLLSRMYDGAQMVSAMNLLDGDAAGFDEHLFVTLGNHEFDPGDLDEAGLLDRRIEEAAFYWFGTNVRFREGEDGLPLVAAHNLLASALVEVGEGPGAVTVGLFGITIPTAETAYVETFGDPLETARRQVAELRRAGAEVVVAVTHLNAQQDADLLRALPGETGPDLVIGGHDHKAMEIPVGERWVFKSDAEAVTARVIDVTLPAGGGDGDAGPPLIEERLVDLDAAVPEDPAVAARVEGWLDLHEEHFCADQDPPRPAGCLEEVIGHTRVELIGEEVEIRAYETNLGNWVADRALAVFGDDAGLPAAVDPTLPRVAFVNSGSLRLNQNVPPGPVEVRVLEELFAYPMPLVLLQIDGATLRRVLERSVEEWGSAGWWLQVAGLAFRHDPRTATVSDVTLLDTPEGPRPLRDDDVVLAVTGTYLVDPTLGDQDGYTMLNAQQVVASGPDLKATVREALRAAEPEGIAPAVEGRICNPLRAPLPCRAVAGE